MYKIITTDNTLFLFRLLFNTFDMLKVCVRSSKFRLLTLIDCCCFFVVFFFVLFCLPILIINTTITKK